jgi:two-component system sensor histidine kinase AlgZ
MRDSSILSVTPPEPVRSSRTVPAAARAPASATASVFEACRVGVVLRAVLLVEGSLAIVMIFATSSPAEWLIRTSVATAGALPGTLHWLVAMCAVKGPMARMSPRAQYALGIFLGIVSALFSCALLWLTGVTASVSWIGCATAGAMFSTLVMAGLALRARSQMPAATTARLQELQARIRPHFLFNTLNSAIALVRDEPAKAETLLEDLSELFRGALAEPGASVTLGEEITLARRYLAIEEVRFEERLAIEWDIDPEADGARLPPLLLQPLVENSVKHGIEPSPRGGTVLVRTRKRGGMAVIEVVNTLAPPPEDGVPRSGGHGIALANVRDRLDLLHDVQAHFSAGIDQNNYRVRIAVPLGT